MLLSPTYVSELASVHAAKQNVDVAVAHISYVTDASELAPVKAFL
jgi:hypothetical protein